MITLQGHSQVQQDVAYDERKEETTIFSEDSHIHDINIQQCGVFFKRVQ